MPRRYAATTNVAISKSRAEITATLRRFGAFQWQWTDDATNFRAMLRFMWEHDAVAYSARFTLQFPTETELRESPECIDGRTGLPSESKVAKYLERIGMVEHRALALWLKACFVAVEEGIIEATQVFLPFLEDAQGSTVSEIVIPRLNYMLALGGAKNLLGTG